MQLSNRILASFIIVFIISILFGTTWVLNEIDKLTGAGLVERVNVSVTIAGVCGDNIQSGTEQCDGSAPSNTTCVTRGFDAGTLQCLSNCNFDTSQCTNVTEAAAAAGGPETGGFAPAQLTYNIDLADSYSVALTRVRKLNIQFNGATYEFSLHRFRESPTTVAITRPDGTVSLLDFGLGQTKPVDLDQDGILDVYVTLVDELTRRAVFNIEKFKPLNVKLSQKQKASLSEPTLETPRFEYYGNYYLDAALLLMLVILAIINFAIFKKFIISKK